MQSAISASRQEVCLQYLPNLRRPLSAPLSQGDADKGIAEVMKYMDQYHLTREDWTAVFDLTQFSIFPDPIIGILSSTKTKFTREYNKSHKTVAPTRSSAPPPPSSIDPINDPTDDINDEESEEEKDSLIKEKKPKKPRTPKVAKKPPTKKKSTN